MGRRQKLLCALGYHKPKQTEVKMETPLVVEKRMIGYVGIQLGDSVCVHCNKKVKIYRQGFFGPGSDLQEWKLANKMVLDFVKKKKSEID